MFIATLIAADRLARGDISAARNALAAAGIAVLRESWVEPDEACDLSFAREPGLARAVLEGVAAGVDVIVQIEAGRRKKLLVADMDSTIITIECIDELADYAGLRDRIAEVTERAMRGEMEFDAALAERVGLLRGMTEATLDRCHEEKVRLSPGAKALVGTMKRHGARSLLVSGGFTRFADRVAAEAGFDRAIANRLGLWEGKLDGKVEGPIVGAAAKRQALIDAAAGQGIGADEVVAVGDGANDIGMLEAAGLGVAYRAKPAAAAAADARIESCDLTALLFAQGYARSAWATG